MGVKKHASQMSDTAVAKVGWRVAEWCAATGLGKSTVWALIAAGRLRTVTVGKCRVITTSPAEFLAAAK